jgi:cytochrome P450
MRGADTGAETRDEGGLAPSAASPAAVAGMIQLTDYEEISEVLKSRKFVQGSQALVRDTLMKDVLFMLDGEEHLARKRILTRLLDDGAVAWPKWRRRSAVGTAGCAAISPC